MKNSITTSKFPLTKGKEWFRLPERLLNLEKLRKPYKEYTALLLQTKDGNPIAYELENGIGDISFLYEQSGVYRIVPGKDVKFDEKTTVDIDYYGRSGDPYTKVIISRKVEKKTGEIIFLIATYVKEVLTNDVLDKTRIEIRIYN